MTRVFSKIWIIVIGIILLLLVGGFWLWKEGVLTIIKRNCQQDSDCINTCSFGCLNRDSIYRDPIKCEFLLECECFNDQCVEKQPKGTKDETANWKTYRNEEYGFEIKYPVTFRVEEARAYWGVSPGPILSVGIYHPDYCKIVSDYTPFKFTEGMIIKK